jgi:hypothetical protein
MRIDRRRVEVDKSIWNDSWSREWMRALITVASDEEARDV